MPDLHYEHPKLVRVYDLGNGWSEAREFYLSLAGDEPKRILDLGCGTGLLCNAFAEKGHLVTGADPAASMLEAARDSRLGAGISWIKSGAQDFRSGHRFDLIVMTGHAFQVLLSDNDILDAFASIREHLSSNGLFAFESRNPQIPWDKVWNGMRRELRSPHDSITESFAVRSAENERIVFETEYAFEDETLVSVSELRFASRQLIERYLEKNGLRVHQMFGGWDRSPFDHERSREMIFLVKHAR